jgi:hypothetical protein
VPVEQPETGAGAFPVGRMPRAGRPFGRWRRWAAGFVLAFLYTVVGTLLVLLPWLPNWDQNYFSGAGPGWYAVWMSPYFRGAISGVGLVNLCVSFLELLDLLRGAKH